MKRMAVLTLALALLCSGCSVWEAQPPLEAVEAVQTMGVDYGDGVRVSVCTGTEDSAERIDDTGETLRVALDALRDRSQHGGLFYGHTQYLLLGEDFARAGIQELLDFVGRSAELRLATPVYVLRGTAADAVLDKELDVTGQLGAMERTGAPSVTALETVDAFARSGAALVAALTYDCDAKALRPDGCAVLSDGRLAGYLDARDEAAVAWLNGAGGESIALPDGATVTVTNCKAHIHADWDDGEITAVTLTLQADAAVDQLKEDLTVTDESVRRALEQALAREMAQRTAAAVHCTQALRADALGLGARLFAAQPIRWQRGDPDWSKRFPNVPVTVTVRAHITGTQDLTDPVPQEGSA